MKVFLTTLSKFDQSQNCLILICYIFAVEKVLKKRLFNLLLLTIICLNLTDLYFAWFSLGTSDFFLMAFTSFSYLIMSILYLFYVHCAQYSYKHNQFLLKSAVHHVKRIFSFFLVPIPWLSLTISESVLELI